VQDASGNVLTPLQCQGFYAGGGGTLLLAPPIVLPDMAQSVYKVTSCAGGTISVSATTSVDTGSTRNCTSAGCLFGPPLPVVNAGNPATSACIKMTHRFDSTAGATCSTGAADMEAFLGAEIRVAGDPQGMAAFGLCSGGPTPGARCFGGDCGAGGTCTGIMDRCKGGANDNLPCATRADCPDGFCTAGVQPCPVCYADSTSPTGSRCVAGPNVNMPCTPGSSELGDAYPTSHDCPSGAPVAGTLPIDLILQSGVATKTANASGTFQGCGFCQDANGTLKFGICAGGPTPGVPCADPSDCGTGGTCGGLIPCTSDANCAEPREKCTQRDGGAFGFPTARTITEVGLPAGNLADGLPHQGILTSVGCSTPTLTSTIDAGADLPGPSALALPGTIQLTP
jgi:hypothetical protein